MIKLGQRGDTLIEVTMALAIIGMVITGAFVLSDKALQLGLTARERSQMVSAAQEQAETLISYRDSNDWPTFSQKIGSLITSSGKFHMAVSGGVWSPTGGTVVSDILPGGNQIWVESSDAGLGVTTYHFAIHYSEPAIGGGTNSSVIYLQLTNLDPLRQ
jgi:prepilin-type N-terminal cleavage/methylation domain-containing protein